MNLRIAAVDLGASSGRVLVASFDEATGKLSELIEYARFANGPVATAAGLYWDFPRLWQEVVGGLQAAAAAGPLAAIGIDTWGVDYGFVTPAGALAGPVASYRWQRTDKARAQLHQQLSLAELYQLTGCQDQPFNTLYQTLADGPEPESCNTALLLPDLISFLLTGKKVCEVTNASTTGMLDPATRTWQPQVSAALTKLGAQLPGAFSQLVEPGTVIGPVKQEIVAAKTAAGLPTPVVAVASHDTASAVAAIPAGADENWGFISCGTWSLVGLELASPCTSAAAQQANFTNELGVDGTVRFLKNIMGMWVQHGILADFDAAPNWEHLAALRAAAPAGRSIFAINDPTLAAPGPMLPCIDALCRKAGVPVPRNLGEYLRAFTDSLAVSYAEALATAARLIGRSIDHIYLVGGGCNDELLCQTTADLTGLPVHAGPVEATAWGNILVSLSAIGALAPGSAARRQLLAATTASKTFLPQRAEAAAAPTVIKQGA